MNPAKLQRLLQDALAHHNAGRFAEAETLYKQAHTAAPKLFDPLHLSGVLAYQQGRYTDAADRLTRALKIDPRSALCEMRLGLALAALNRHSEAEARYRSSLKRDGKMPEAWNNLAVTLRALSRNDEALVAYKRAVELKPDYYDALDRLGALVADTQGLSAGIPYFRRAVGLKPDYAPAWCNLGLALTFDRKYTEALDCFTHALTIDPKLAHAQVGRGLVLQQTYRLQEAIASYGEALDRQPDHHEARSARLLTLNYLPAQNRQEIFDEHLTFGRLVNPQATPQQIFITNTSPRLRVAFLSPDLRNHSIAYFIEPLLRHLDQTQFEIILYHDHFQVDAMSERLRSYATLWRNFVGQTNAAVEKTIRSDAPDILIDLAGHTGFNRLPLLARQVAPVQISYLGYPNTTGLREMHYRFVDALTDPGPDDDKFYTEKLVRFSPCAWAYAPPANAPEPAMPTPDLITFGSFNNFAKVSSATLSLWQRVLAAVPDSRLLLKAHSLNDPALSVIVEQNLKSLGIDRSRIEVARPHAKCAVASRALQPRRRRAGHVSLPRHHHHLRSALDGRACSYSARRPPRGQSIRQPADRRRAPGNDCAFRR
ncbi:MAG: tetratricopeptide repeat protein [Verrucomicrobia bacterium]|nr:tetratricopeptide repeat protein [Verrucomicrobiota bacterium]